MTVVHLAPEVLLDPNGIEVLHHGRQLCGQHVATGPLQVDDDEQRVSRRGQPAQAGVVRHGMQHADFEGRLFHSEDLMECFCRLLLGCKNGPAERSRIRRSA